VGRPTFWQIWSKVGRHTFKIASIFEVGKKIFVEKYFFFAFYERLSFFDGKYGYFITFDQQISAKKLVFRLL